MFVIKEVESGKFAKLPERRFNEEGLELAWDLVENAENAQQYTTLEHANEIAFWHLDLHKKWKIVDLESGKEYEKRTGKYIPV